MKKILIGLLSLVFIVSLSHVCIVEATLDNISIGGDIRVRGVMTKNIRDLNDDTKLGTVDNAEFVRHRTRVWFKGEFEGGYTGYVRFCAEPRWGNPDFGAGTNWTNNIVIDNSYIVAPDFLGTPLTLKIGRQDMTYGEGFLIFDGTPTDGSRTIYFDAIKLSTNFGDSAVDFFTAKVAENNFDDADDETLYGVYATNKAIENHKLEGYLLYRARDLAVIAGEALKISTTAIGVRSTGKIIDNLTYGAEITKQFGTIEPDDPADTTDRDIDALGGYAHVTYAMPEVESKPSIKAGLYYTSGDDGTTEDYEGWDNFYSEFPKYGNILAYMANLDDDIGTWTNYMIAELRLMAEPAPKLSTSLAYLMAMANEKNGAKDDDRGSWPQAMVKYQFSDNVAGHLLGEYFMPGDYYAPFDDDAFFTRFELMMKF